MSAQLQIAQNKEVYTPDQVKLIKDSLARNATNDEFQLFMYRAKVLGLDPLKPGQIHFVKYGTGPGSVVIGIEGFRTFAHRTNMMSGIERGVKRDEKGKLLYGWCRVHRKDWTQPAYEEVSFVEYDTGRNNWSKMPETMIKKVAEAATLRMAFPTELGGVYSEEEMEKANETSTDVKPTAYGQPEHHFDDGQYVLPFGYSVKEIQLKGLSIDRIYEKIGQAEIENMSLRFSRILSGEEKSRMVLSDQRKADLTEFTEVAETLLKSLDKGIDGEDAPF